MTIRLSTGLRNALCGSSGFSATFAAGVIEIRTGTQPTSADAAATGVLLGTVTTASGAFTPGVPANGIYFEEPDAGVVRKSGVWSMVGIANGTAGWFRFKGNAIDTGALSTVHPRFDGSIATSGADMNLSNISILVGAPTTIDSFIWTQPAG